MKHLAALLSLVFLLFLVGCESKKANPKVTYDGEMIEILSPQPGDTFSWVLVTGKATITKGTFPLELIGENGTSIKRRSVILSVSAPDTSWFAMGFPVGEDLAPQKGRIRAYSTSAESREEAIVPCYLVPGASMAHGTILRFFAALDTNDFKAAYGLLSAQGQSYPDFYQGEAVFSPRPSLSTFKRWKDKDTRMRVITLRPQTMYDLPRQGLFCYRARLEYKKDAETEKKEYYMFLKRQPDGFFKLYMPRKGPHKVD